MHDQDSDMIGEGATQNVNAFHFEALKQNITYPLWV